jgi:membrane associated rhomboid family serine protease
VRKFERGWTYVGYLPITVLVVGGLCGYLATNGVYTHDVFTTFSLAELLNPVFHGLSMVVHADWAHYQANIRPWLVFGTALTLLTSNRHVLGVAVTSHVLMNVVGIALLKPGVGLSGAIYAVAAAALVRSIGVAFQNAASQTRQWALVSVFVPLAAGVFLIMVVVGPSPVGHFHHFLAFLFGGAMEAMYVFEAYGDDETAARSAPGRLIG